MAWDVNLMRSGCRTGDAYVYVIVAHEWGHAVQNRLAIGLRYVARELQADCLAGAALDGADEDGTIVFEAGDGVELTRATAGLFDRFPWSKVDDHGSATPPNGRSGRPETEPGAPTPLIRAPDDVGAAGGVPRSDRRGRELLRSRAASRAARKRGARMSPP